MIEEGCLLINTRARALNNKLQKVEAPPSQSSLLTAIHDQQVYLGLTNTLLTLAREAGAPPEALKQVSEALLHSRGFTSAPLLQEPTFGSDESQKSKEKYNWLRRGIAPGESQALLCKLERQLLESREKESHYRCLQKYKSQKSDEMAPSSSGSPSSRKERFNKMLKERAKRKTVESSDFFKFEVRDILENSYKYENECYRTIGSFSHLKTMFGHTSEPDIDTYSQIFNAILDRSEKLVVSGGEEGTIKIWHRESGTLVRNLRGHIDYLNKLEISPCNRYMISSAGDGLRFFDLVNLRPLGGWKTSSIAEITALTVEGESFFLFGESSCLYILTEKIMLEHAQDRLQVCHFYQLGYQDLIEQEGSSILVIALSPQKTHILIGLQNGHLLVVEVSELLQIVDNNVPGDRLTLPCVRSLKAHHEEIIEVKWSSNGILWATGAKDGRCCLWEMLNGHIQLLTTLSVSSKHTRGRRKRHSYSCTYICWNCTHTHFAAGFQENVQEEDSDRGRGEVLVYSLKAQRVTSELSKDVSQEYGGIRAMDAHPTYPNILLICQADGHVLLFDMFLGCIVNTFEQRGFHIMHPQFQLIPTECHFTKDGLSFIVATEYGSISIYGYDSKNFFVGAPVEQFLKSDFQQVQFEETSMKVLKRGDDLFEEDLNCRPRGELMNVRLQKQIHTIEVDPDELLRALNSRHCIKNHLPQKNKDKSFMKIIENNFKQSEAEEQLCSKILEEVERVKQLVLFHERERQYLTVMNLTNEKLKLLRPMLKNTEQEQQESNRIFPQTMRASRKLKRHSDRRIRYVDDFEYPESEEEQFIADSNLEPQIPDEQEELSDLIDDDDEPRQRRRDHRPLRRKTRQAIASTNGQNEDEQQPQIVTRRRRRDISEELRELEHQYAPRKKVKAEEQSSSERKFSRLKKYIKEEEQMEEEFGECYRCQLVKATVYCKGCEYTQQYCEECSKMRGKKSLERFSCLICLFLQNTSFDENYNVSEELYRLTQRSHELYVPQLEDKVRYFFQGYEEFLVQNIGRLNPIVYQQNEKFRILPHSEDSELLGTPLCQVISIEYCYPLKSENALGLKRTPGKGEKVVVQMLIGLRAIQSGSVFWVFYWPGFDYLLLEEIFTLTQQKDLTSIFNINQLAYIGSEELQIIQLGPFQDRFPQSLWKLMKVRKTQGKRLRGNTKEIQKRVNVWRLLQQTSDIHLESALNQKKNQKVRTQIEMWLSEDNSPYCFFNDYVDFQIYPQYRQQVPVGICLQVILQRLQHLYYRGEASLKQDINMILGNSLVFNGSNHPVTHSAEEACKILVDMIEKQEAQPCHSLIKSMEINIKEKKEQYKNQNVSLMEKSNVSRQKDPQNHNQKNRRKVSSDYEGQDSYSLEVDASAGIVSRKTRVTNNNKIIPQVQRRITRSGKRQ